MDKLFLDIVDTCDASPHPSRVEYKAFRAISGMLYHRCRLQVVMVHHLLPELLQHALYGDDSFSPAPHILILPPSSGLLGEQDPFSSVVRDFVHEGGMAVAIHFCYTQGNSVLTETFGTFFNEEIHRLREPVFRLELGYASFLSKERFASLKNFQLEYDELSLSVANKYKKGVESLITVQDFPVVTVNAFGKGFAFSFGFHSLTEPVVGELLSSLLLFGCNNREARLC